MSPAEKNNQPQFGLFSRMFISMLAMLVVALAILSYSLLQNAANQFDDFRVKHAQSLAHTLAEASRDSITSGDFTGLDRFIKLSLPSHFGSYIYLARPNGDVISSTDKSLVKMKFIPPKIDKESITRTLQYNNRPVIEVVNKVTNSDSHLANIHIAYYTDKGNFSFLGQASNIIISLSLTLMIIIAGTYIFVSKIKNPILSLINTITNTNYNSSFKLPDNMYKRKDEVGVLARTFDDVYNRLYTANLKTKNATEKLEENVQKRTQQLAEINEELDTEKKQINTILDNAGDSILTVNDKGLIETFNNAAEALFGYKFSEIKGRNVTTLMPASYHEQHGHAFNKFVSNDNITSINNEAREVKGKRKNGTEFPLELKLNYIDFHGKKLFIGILRDITLQKQTKEMLERSNELLEEKVKDRTNKLNKINKELMLARDTALDASKIKSEFLSTISHELRTPLHTITGYENVLSQSDLSDEQSKFCEKINTGAQNLLEIINEILDFSAFESGKIKIANDKISITEIIKDIFDVFNHSANKKGLKLSYNISSDIPAFIFSDMSRLRQTIVNLVNNAIKFTEKGSIKITAKIDKTNTNMNKSLLICVEDTGIGVSIKQHDKIFSPFYQVDGSVTRSYGGTGIGLAMSKNIIELMGGTISIDSQAGQGSTFIISLPLITDKSNDINEELSPVSLAQDYIKQTHSYNITSSESDKRILIVEDNEINAELLTILVNEAGYDADVAENGSIFLEMIAQNDYDLVLMDCQMPILNGYDATSQYRQSEASDRHIPIIAVTANAMVGDREKCISSGMDDYIEKPVQPEILKNTIYTWLEESKKFASV